MVEDHQPLIGDAAVGDGTGLMLVVEKFPEANVHEVTRAVDEAMATLAPGLSGITINTNVYRPATFLETALRNVGLGIAIGLLLLAVRARWPSAVVAGRAGRVRRHPGRRRGRGVRAVPARHHLQREPGRAGRRAGHRDRRRGGHGRGDPRRGCGNTARRGRRPTGASLVVEAALATRGPLLYATLVVLLRRAAGAALGGVAGAFARPLVLSYVLAVSASIAGLGHARTGTVGSALVGPAGSAARQSAGAVGAARVRPGAPVADAAPPGLAARRRPRAGGTRGRPAARQLADAAGAAGPGPAGPLRSTPGTSLRRWTAITAAMSRGAAYGPGRRGRRLPRRPGAERRPVGQRQLRRAVVAGRARRWTSGRATGAVKRVVAGYPGLRQQVDLPRGPGPRRGDRPGAPTGGAGVR